jgi:hypothetical protein
MAKDPKEVLYSKLAFLLAVTASDDLAGDIAAGTVNTNVFNNAAYDQMMTATGFDQKPAGRDVYNALATIRAAFSANDLWPDDECDWSTIATIFSLPSPTISE